MRTGGTENIWHFCFRLTAIAIVGGFGLSRARAGEVVIFEL